VNKNLVITAVLISGLALAQSTWPTAPTTDGKPKLLETHSMTGVSVANLANPPYNLEKATKNGFPNPNLVSFGSAIVWGNGNEFYGITDRGPNGDHKNAAGEVIGKLFPLPEFNPTIMRLALDGASGLKMLETIPLVDAAGKGVSGLPNDKTDDIPFAEPGTDAKAIGFNPNGVDTEAIQRLPDGKFIFSEENSPSVLIVSAKGEVLMRYTPANKKLEGATYPVKNILPAVLSNRRGNRGFENLALSKDGKTAFVIMQSSMGSTKDAQLEASRVVRAIKMDVSDPLNAKVTGMYLVPTSPKADYPATKDQRDLKYSEAVWIAQDKLLMLERAAKLVKLFVVDFAKASNILDRPEANNNAMLFDRANTDLKLYGVEVPTREQVFSSADLPQIDEEKLEGLAVLNSSVVALAHDNDFGIGDNTTNAPSKLWIVQLPKELPVAK
jgi:Esterase-like activity of phytase